MNARRLQAFIFATIMSCAPALLAKRPVAVAVDVAPTPITAGQPLAITTSLTNNSSDAQSVSVRVEMRGPCGVSGSKGYKVLLTSKQVDTSKAAFQTPACPGEYEATLTISDHDGAILGGATAHFQVEARDTHIASAKGK